MVLAEGIRKKAGWYFGGCGWMLLSQYLTGEKKESVHWVPQEAFQIFMLGNKNKLVAMLYDLFNQSSAILLLTKFNCCEEIRMQVWVPRWHYRKCPSLFPFLFTICWLKHLFMFLLWTWLQWFGAASQSKPQSRFHPQVFFLERIFFTGTSLGINAA